MPSQTQSKSETSKIKGDGVGSRRSELDEPMAPDGGWGWVILLASFFSSVIVDGVCFAFGIFYLEFLDTFQENKGKTAWIGSVLNGTYMIMGPIVGALANHFGCRAVAIVGSAWAAVAFFISTFSPNVETLIVTYGILGGMGFGLMYLPSIVIVGYYFDKKRAFATGVATCGSGIGAFIFAPLCKWLIDVYAWRGAMWIVAAIVLNGLVLGALYRPLTFDDLEEIRLAWREQQEAKERALVEAESKLKNANGHLAASEYTAEKEPFIADSNGSSNVEVRFPEKMVSGKTVTLDMPSLRKRKYSTTSSFSGSLSTGPKMGDSWHSLTGYATSMETMSYSKRSFVASGYMGGTPPEGGCSYIIKEIMSNVRSSFDFTMIKDPVFVIYGFSCILCMAGFFVPFIYLPALVKDLGYPASHGAILLSILGITNTVGRIMAGWVSDRPWADCLLINNFSLIIGGIATIFCPFCKSYTLLIIYSCIFGLCIAAFVSLRSIILVDLIGLDKLTSAFGIIVLCQGITSFVGAPIAGSLYDVTGTYNLSFYVAGATITCSGLINMPLRRIARWRSKGEDRRKSDTLTMLPGQGKRPNPKDKDDKKDAKRKQNEKNDNVSAV